VENSVENFCWSGIVTGKSGKYAACCTHSPQK
jgi:hypothetical protein